MQSNETWSVGTCMDITAGLEVLNPFPRCGWVVQPRKPHSLAEPSLESRSESKGQLFQVTCFMPSF